MKKQKLALVFVLLFLAGCSVRTYTVEKPRSDTKIDGNRGYLSGSGSYADSDEIGTRTRKVSVMEIELGKKKKSKTYQPQTSLNEEVGGIEEIESSNENEMDNKYLDESRYSSQTTQSSVSKKESSSYTIAKNDTLQKISKKFYGTTKKWKKIYDANTDTLKSPDRLYPGKKIRIPK